MIPSGCLISIRPPLPAPKCRHSTNVSSSSSKNQINMFQIFKPKKDWILLGPWAFGSKTYGLPAHHCQLSCQVAQELKTWLLYQSFPQVRRVHPLNKNEKKNAGGNPLVETHWNPRKVDKGWSHFMHWALLEKKGSLSVKKVADISQVKISWTHSNNWMMDSNSTLNMQ